MARNVGLIGGLRGKLGNAVFYIQNGSQISRVYQPVVANPNTPLQIAQRAKMALAGRLMGITPASAVAGLPAGNVRDRRGLFVRSLVRASSYSSNKASISWSDLILSEGNLGVEMNHTAARVNHDSYIQINLQTTRATAELSVVPGYAERVVVYLIDSTASEKDSCSTRLVTLPSADTPASTAVNIHITPGTAANYTPVVYVIPMVSNEVIGGVNYSWVGTETETYVVINGIRSSAALTYGRSVYVPIT